MRPLTWVSTWWRTRRRPATTPGEESPTVRLLLPAPPGPAPAPLTAETQLPPLPPAFTGPGREPRTEPAELTSPEYDMRRRLIAAGVHPGGVPQ